tara:strand:- start:1890 stop:2060 length:171 start_codon:yes stop_codon:yes gene_type:complete
LNDHGGKIILFKTIQAIRRRTSLGIGMVSLSGRNYQLASNMNIFYKIGFTFEDTTT